MDINLERLKKRAMVLGNHYQKYIHTIEKNLDQFLGRLESARALERIHLWNTAHDYHEEMATVAGLGKNTEQNLSDLACYFSFQFLQMNLSALDALMLEVTTYGNNYNIYKNFMLRVGHDFRALTAAYMKHLLKTFYPEISFADFVFLGVGTRSDQDDIDIGVVDRGEKGRDALNRAIAHMNSEMLKKAISTHFHLSEHVGSNLSFSTSIEEYIQLLDKEIHDFVIITEMLGAAAIIGCRPLFFEFRRRVTSRYYYSRENHDNKFHEGYLRGIAGEMRAFMFRDVGENIISPKDDGLRMIKAALYAAKTIFQLRQVNAWAICETLELKDPKRRLIHQQLKASLTFLEIFRYLYQLMIAQEEDIHLDVPCARNNLGIIAIVMGYQSDGAASATDFLLTDYYRNVHQAKETVATILSHATKHLESITVFGRVLQHKKVTDPGEKRIGNLALRFLQETRFFRGTNFWDDIITALQQKDGRILKRIANDLSALDPVRQTLVMREFIEWGYSSFYAMFSFIILLHEYHSRLDDPQLYHEFNNLFLESIKGTNQEVENFIDIFQHYQRLMHNYINLLNSKQQRQFHAWLDIPLWDQEMRPVRNRLQLLLKLHFNSSTYFERVVNNVLNEHPEYVDYFDNSERLLLIGKGSLAEVERTAAFKYKLKKLKFYFDFEFFRIGLNTLTSSSMRSIALEFTEFSDIYLKLLFDTCKRELDEQRGSALNTKDLFGIFITGGQGQMLAFDDDYDLIILLNTEDKVIMDYCDMIIRRMHRELVKCGIMPHYRIADFTNSFLCTFKQLEQILQDNTEERIVDKSQLLIARMIVGSSVLLNAFDNQILLPFVYNDRNQFVKFILEEIHSRRNLYKQDASGRLNVKEDPGGLRDLELLLLMYRVIYRLKEHSNYALWDILRERETSLHKEFTALSHGYGFLRQIRNLNRLTIAASNELDPEFSQNMLDIFNMKSTVKISSVKSFMQRVQKTMKKNDQALQVIIDNLAKV